MERVRSPILLDLKSILKIFSIKCQPISKRLLQSVSVNLSGDMLQPIHLFRYDSLYKHIYILAGINEGIEIIIFEDGSWEFYKDDET